MKTPQPSWDTEIRNVIAGCAMVSKKAGVVVDDYKFDYFIKEFTKKLPDFDITSGGSPIKGAKLKTIFLTRKIQLDPSRN